MKFDKQDRVKREPFILFTLIYFCLAFYHLSPILKLSEKPNLYWFSQFYDILLCQSSFVD